MHRTLRLVARLATTTLLAAALIAVPAVVLHVVGVPFPGLTQLRSAWTTQRIDEDLVLRIGATVFSLLWVWFAATALAELPVTTTVLLRAIQGIAAEHGFDPAEEGVEFDCIQVFSAAGPLEHDDGSDLAFISTRVLVTGSAIQALIARVAPRLAVVLGQKLAAQTVPVLGAVAGAATNYAYTSYYQDMAHVHFGLRRHAITADRDQADLVEALRERVRMAPVKRAG